jgi:general secretion pathway protein L
MQMRPELEQASDRAYAALNWWLEGLWIGLPAGARSALFTERTELVVRLTGDEATISGHAVEPVTVDTNDANARTTLAHGVPKTHVPDVTVLLPRGVVLTHALRLPAAVESDLHNVLRYELDRLTPFAIEDVTFDYRIRERNDSALLVEVALARRAALDDVDAKLERLGLRPTAATIEDANGARLPLNVLPRRRRVRLPAARLSLRPALGLGAALLFAAGLCVPPLRYERILAAQTATVETARTEAVAARARLAEQEAALASGELLAKRRSGYVPPVALLRELTAQLPEHTWVSRFSISRGEVLLQGESASATELLQLLESTELLRDARFQSPVARGNEAGKEQFTILANLARSAP